MNFYVILQFFSDDSKGSGSGSDSSSGSSRSASSRSGSGSSSSDSDSASHSDEDVDVEGGPDDVKPAKVGHSDSASSQESQSDSRTATKSRQNHFYTDKQLAKVTSLFRVSTIISWWNRVEVVDVRPFTLSLQCLDDGVCEISRICELKPSSVHKQNQLNWLGFALPS